MKKFYLPIIGLVVFVLSVIFIAGSGTALFFFPSQEVELSHALKWGRLLEDNLLVQEITLSKRYLSRIDVCLAKMPSKTPNENVFLLLNAEHRILFTKKFSSDEIDGAVWLSFKLKKNLDIGKNHKVVACIYSVNGDQQSSSVYSRSDRGNLGKLYVTTIQNNDVIYSIENPKSVTQVEGSLGLKIFETNTNFFSPLQLILYLFFLGLSLIIAFAGKLKTFLLKSKPAPEYIYLPIALTFGLLFAFLTPPFQVPDEPSHLYRAYQVSELNLFKYHDSIPKSLVHLAAISERMKFNVAEKTSRKEILGLSSISLAPAERTYSETPNYIIPYLPQATGLFLGRIFHASPISFFYLGRILNLLAAVFFLFLAIRITPVFKWVFFLLGIMPMTLYLMASLSYDASTICLTFLFISIIFKLAFDEKQKISSRQIISLFIIGILLASSKPPYYISVFSFLIIPVQKFGSWKKFLMIFTGLVVTTLLVSQLWLPARKFFKNVTAGVASSSSISQASMFPTFSFGEQVEAVSNPQSKPKEPVKSKTTIQDPSKTQTDTGKNTTNQASQPEAEKKAPPPKVESPYDQPAQKNYILSDPFRFIGILTDTIKKFLGIYVIAFIGLFGWVDAPLPPALIYSFLILLIIVSLSDATPGIKINFLRKSILLVLFLIGFLLVETAMYVCCNPVGSPLILAVQGRYFIALSPLLFIFLYNNLVNKTMNHALMQPSAQREKAKGGKKKKQVGPSETIIPLYSKIFPWVVIGFGLFALLYSIYHILFRFYIVLI